MTRKTWISAALAIVFALGVSLPALAIKSRECTELCDCNSSCTMLCSLSYNGPFDHTCGQAGICVGGYDCLVYSPTGTERAASPSTELPWLTTACSNSEMLPALTH